MQAIDVPLTEMIRLPLACEQHIGCSYRTGQRYRLKGVRGVRLRCVLVGGVLKTHPKWIAEFLAKINGDDAGEGAAATSPSGGPEGGRAANTQTERLDREQAAVEALLK